mgnify:CR=1 FL=1
MLNAGSVDRAYMDLTTDEILQFSEEATSITELELLVYELQFRSPKSSEVKHRKAEAYLKLLNALQSRKVQPLVKTAEVVKINKVISRENRSHYKRLQGFEWREVGVLKSSGYSVGESSPVYKNERYKILDSLILLDDLDDVSDRVYANEYGAVKTEKRLSKIVNSISYFIVNASRVTTRDNSKAISDWKGDLDYLRASYSRVWPEFHWPDA